jgi:hypothetical protein
MRLYIENFESRVSFKIETHLKRKIKKIMDMQTKNFFILYFGSARIVFVSGAQLSPLLTVQVVKVLITQDETTLILDYKLERSIMLVLLIFCNFETPS